MQPARASLTSDSADQECIDCTAAAVGLTPALSCMSRCFYLGVHRAAMAQRDVLYRGRYIGGQLLPLRRQLALEHAKVHISIC
jgi:hypothetical protein